MFVSVCVCVRPMFSREFVFVDLSVLLVLLIPFISSRLNSGDADSSLIRIYSHITGEMLHEVDLHFAPVRLIKVSQSYHCDVLRARISCV